MKTGENAPAYNPISGFSDKNHANLALDALSIDGHCAPVWVPARDLHNLRDDLKKHNFIVINRAGPQHKGCGPGCSCL